MKLYFENVIAIFAFCDRIERVTKVEIGTDESKIINMKFYWNDDNCIEVTRSTEYQDEFVYGVVSDSISPQPDTTSTSYNYVHSYNTSIEDATSIRSIPHPLLDKSKELILDYPRHLLKNKDYGSSYVNKLNQIREFMTDKYCPFGYEIPNESDLIC